MVDGKKPRSVPDDTPKSYYSGIELVEVDESSRPLIVGERTNVIGSRAFKNLIAEEMWEEATEIARRQVRNGAHVVDVCLQSTDRDEIKDIPPFYEKLIRKVKAPIMIDTTDPKGDRVGVDVLARQGADQLDQPGGWRGEVRAGMPDREGVRRRAGGRHD
jgi:5-methyltetrahydrofolate--homocysteine methyltransferase